MPFDKHNATSGTGRPLMPTLSAAAKMSKTPMTARIAAPNAPSASISPSVRRGNIADASNTPKRNSREDLPSPVKAIMSSNITPRSSSRKARVDSAPTTPNGTPNGTPSSSRPVSTIEPFRWADESTLCPTDSNATLRPGSLLTEGKQTNVSFAPSPSSSAVSQGHKRTGSDLGARESPPMFFYASDVKSPAIPIRSQPSRPAAPGKTPNFFYANSVNNLSSPAASTISTSSSSEVRPPPRFFRANEVSEQPTSRQSPLYVHSTSCIASSSSQGTSPSNPLQLKSPRLASLNPAFQTPQKYRSPSPPKTTTSMASLRENSPLASAAANRPATSTLDVRHSGQGRGETYPNFSTYGTATDPQGRRGSHGRSASVGSMDTSPRSQTSSRGETNSPSSPPTSLKLVTTVAELIPVEVIEESRTEQTDDLSGSLPKATPSMPQSPSKSSAGHMSLQQMNDLAANARRERKVLDLEISNSSLLAINRTLEREMRKQNAELRRYRRLSRSGRLSLTATSTRSSVDGFFSFSEGADHSELSSMTEEEEEEESPSDDESLDDDTLSPSAMAESDARHREKDEKRLQLDLSKHQQLLIDSQKMNQSLRKCLGWTEELIKEGKKALEYSVKVSDVQLGGRVLVADDLDATQDDVELRKHESWDEPIANIWITPTEHEKDDRDSGVDVEQNSCSGGAISGDLVEEAREV